MNEERGTKNEEPLSPLADAGAQLQTMFARMEAALEARTAAFAPEIAAAPFLGPCPACKVAPTQLDREGSEEESVRLNRLTLVYLPCGGCEREAALQERMARYGVPRRVRGATFDNYEVTDPGQGDAVDQVRAWVRSRESLFLLMLGKCGTGKGHLAAAAIRESGLSAHWTTHADLIDSYHDLPMSEGKRKAFRTRFQRYSVLVIDEMGGKSMTADTPELMFGILNERHDQELKTILIGNIPLRAPEGKPSVLALLGEDRSESRLLTTSTLIACRWSDYRARAGK